VDGECVRAGWVYAAVFGRTKAKEELDPELARSKEAAPASIRIPTDGKWTYDGGWSSMGDINSAALRDAALGGREKHASAAAEAASAAREKALEELAELERDYVIRARGSAIAYADAQAYGREIAQIPKSQYRSAEAEKLNSLFHHAISAHEDCEQKQRELGRKIVKIRDRLGLDRGDVPDVRTVVLLVARELHAGLLEADLGVCPRVMDDQVFIEHAKTWHGMDDAAGWMSDPAALDVMRRQHDAAHAAVDDDGRWKRPHHHERWPFGQAEKAA
jgi:hypothetical protein